jgi:hypothetical protein
MNPSGDCFGSYARHWRLNSKGEKNEEEERGRKIFYNEP